MKFSEVTRRVLRLMAKLHHFAVHAECNNAARVSERKFNHAADQLQFIRIAQQHLRELQEQALSSQADVHKLRNSAHKELTALRHGVRYE
jgi:hypothetical protein